MRAGRFRFILVIRIHCSDCFNVANPCSTLLQNVLSVFFTRCSCVRRHPSVSQRLILTKLVCLEYHPASEMSSLIAVRQRLDSLRFNQRSLSLSGPLSQGVCSDRRQTSTDNSPSRHVSRRRPSLRLKTADADKGCSVNPLRNLQAQWTHACGLMASGMY